MDEPVVAIFDGVADVYDEIVPFFATFGRLIAAALPDPGAGARLLDVGAGAGAIALAARERGYAVSAVDAAPGMVARLSRVVPDARLADAAALPFPDRVFDVVTAGFVLHLLPDPGAALREIRRVLKPGGLLAFTVVGPQPDGFAEADASTELFAEFSRYLPPGGGMGEPFDPRAELAAAGFRDVTEGHLQVELPLDDAATMWRWYATHGTRKFLDDLPAERREELRRRLVADLEARDAVVLRRAAGFCTARA